MRHMFTPMPSVRHCMNLSCSQELLCSQVNRRALS